MRVVLITDIHLTERDLDLHQQLLKKLVKVVAEAQPDVILIGGDLTGRQVPHRATPQERNAIVGLFVQLVDIAKLHPVVIVRGNHDYPGDWAFLNAVDGLVYLEAPTVVPLFDERSPKMTASVLALPWMDRSAFPQSEEWNDALLRAYRAAADGDADHLKAPAVFLLAHAAVIGASIRLGQPSVPTADPMLRDRDLAGLADFEAGFLGHYHQRQEIRGIATRIAYGGSTFAHEWGEPAEDKGATLWDGERFIALPLGQQTKWVVDVAGDGSIAKVTPEPPEDSFPTAGLAIPGKITRIGEWWPLPGAVRLRAKDVPPEMRGRVAALLEEAAGLLRLRPGITHVEVLAEQANVERYRDGAQEAVEAKTFSDQFGAWLDTLEPKPKVETIQRANELLAEIQSEREGAVR